MRKVKNSAVIEGRIFDYTLEKKVTGPKSKNPNTTYITGDLNVATDDECMNIVTIHYTYVTEKTNAGNSNKTFTTLDKIIESGKTISEDGKENATLVKCSGSAISLNDFFTENAKSDSNPDGLVSAKRLEGGFVSIETKLGPEEKRNEFEVDMLINGTRLVEADPEKNIAEDYLIVKGAVFNFRNDILPIEFIVRNSGGINYFQALDASSTNPIFTKVWGTIKSQTVTTTKQEDVAWGEPVVKEFSKTTREWVILRAAKELYEIGDKENGITAEEITEAVQNRNVILAKLKSDREEYLKSKESETATTATASGFNF